MALIGATGAAAAVLAFSAGRPELGVLSLVAAVLAIALALLVRPGSGDAAFLQDAFTAGLLALPGVLVLYFSFNAGGFFPDAPAFVAIALLALLVLRTTLIDEPFAGFSRPLALAAVALALYAAWVLASGAWSEAPARALVEAVRALVYLLTLVLVGSLARTPQRLAWMLRGIAAAIAAIAVIALATRVLPDVFPTSAGFANERLSYPLTYWNALGMLAALGAIFCLHLTADHREPPPMRILAAAVLPLLASTVFFTFSRASILAGALGVAAYLVLARPRALLGAALATVPLSVLAVSSAYDADLLATAQLTTPAAIEQGRDLAWILAGCALGAALLRAALIPVDRRLAAIRLAPGRRRAVTAAAWASAAVVLVAAVAALDVASRVETQIDRFGEDSPVQTADTRDRLTEGGSNGRIEQWEAALDLFEREPARGIGAGTFGVQWTQDRPQHLVGLVVDDAHSLYLETLAELGAVGIALLGACLVTVLLALLPVRRGPSRPVYAAGFAGVLAWAVHAGVDWDWEMPALTVIVFALGGLALAARPRADAAADAAPEAPDGPGDAGAAAVAAGGHPGPSRGARVAIGLAAVLAAVGPALVLVSERRIDDAVVAFERGDCGAAVDASTAAIEVLSSRPEPYEVLGFCQTRRGFNRLAIRSLEQAVRRDPRNWEFRYGLALVRGAAALDPRPDAREALRLNPRDDRTRNLVEIVERDPDWQPIVEDMARRERLAVVR